MKNLLEDFVRIGLLVILVFLWVWIIDQPFSSTVNLFIVIGAVLWVYPVVGLGRKLLDRNPAKDRVVRVTTFVHYTLLFLFGAALSRAIITHQDWYGWLIPIPAGLGYLLVIVTSLAALLTIVNLALKGLGAPFAIALSRKLAVDWFYAWTRNPMVFATLALLLSLGLWFQSVLFLLWVLILFSPALLFFVKVYEERELEIRFGASYLDYKSKTPLLFPRKPKNK